MEYSGRLPEDAPPPPGTADIIARFGVVPFTFAPQRSLEERGAGSASGSSSGGPEELHYLSLSYTLLRNPDDRDDPVNRSTISERDRQTILSEPEDPLPQWFLEQRKMLLYRGLWEAVRTTPRPGPTPLQTAEEVLVDHARYILMNVFREERAVGRMPAEIISAPTTAGAVPTVARIDGVEVPAVHLDLGAHIYSLAAEVGERLLTVVVPRDDLPFLRMEFETRPPS